MPRTYTIFCNLIFVLHVHLALGQAIPVYDLKDSLLITTLDLSHMNLSEVPEEVAYCKNLRVLSLAHNSISQLPSSLSSLSHLEYISLASNNLSEFPNILSRLTQLKYMDLYDNRIDEFPFSKDHWKHLTYLDLRGIQMYRTAYQTIWEEFEHIPHLFLTPPCDCVEKE